MIPMIRMLSVSVATLLSMTLGCHVFTPRQDSRSTQASFNDLWNTYTHCQTSTDPEALFIDALRLNQAAQTHTPGLPALLKPVQPLVSTLPNRLAVDPKAMAADCSLRAGNAAMGKGWNDLAVELYQSVRPRSSDPDESYYVRQAQAGLNEARLRQALQEHPAPSAVTH